MRIEKTGMQRNIEGLVLRDEELQELCIGKTYREQVNENIRLPKNFYLLNEDKREVGKGEILKRESISGDGIMIHYKVTDLYLHRGDSEIILLYQK